MKTYEETIKYLASIYSDPLNDEEENKKNLWEVAYTVQYIYGKSECREVVLDVKALMENN